MYEICVSLTNRTNYSKLKKILFSLNTHENINLKIVLSSTILLDKYGSSFKDIIKDGFSVDKKIDCVLLNDSHEAMAKTIALSLIEHSSYFSTINPDLLLLVGDRFDMVGPALSASMMNIPIAHIQGGETSGTIDNIIRDLLTRMSCLHFVATKKSALNLEKYGIESNRIFNFGCPAVEYISELEVGDHFDSNLLKKKFKNEIIFEKNEKYIIVMIHPDTKNKLDVDMNKVLKIIEALDVKTCIFYPNVDANNNFLISSLNNFRSNNNFIFIKHIPLDGYIHLLAHCSSMITNSSSGIREAGSFGIPVFNLGFRQKDRERNENVIDFGADYSNLKEKINLYLDKKFPKSNIYYKKNCSKLITDKILDFLQKK